MSRKMSAVAATGAFLVSSLPGAAAPVFAHLAWPHFLRCQQQISGVEEIFTPFMVNRRIASCSLDPGRKIEREKSVKESEATSNIP